MSMIAAYTPAETLGEPISEATLEALQQRFKAAHPNVPYTSETFLNAFISVCASVDGYGTVGLPAAYAAQGDFFRQVLTLYKGPGRFREWTDEAGYTRFAKKISHGGYRLDSLSQAVLARLEPNVTLPATAWLAAEHKKNPGRAIYTTYETECDFGQLLTQGIAQAKNDVITLTPEMYLPYLRAVPAEKWVQHLNAIYPQVLGYNLKLSPEGNVALGTKGAQACLEALTMLHQVAPKINYLMPPDVTVSGFGYQADLAKGHPQIEAIINAMQGTLSKHDGQRRLREIQCYYHPPEKVLEGLATVWPDVAELGLKIEGTAITMPPARFDKLKSDIDGIVRKLLGPEGAEGAQAKLDSIRAAHAPKVKPEKTYAEASTKPATTIAGPAKMESAREAAVNEFMQPLAALQHVIDIGNRLRNHLHGTTSKYRPSEGVRKISFPSEKEAALACERLNRLLEGNGYVFVEQDAEHRRQHWLVVPESTNKLIHEKLTGLVNRLEEIEAHFDADRPKAEALREALAVDVQKLGLVGKHADAAIASKRETASIAV